MLHPIFLHRNHSVATMAATDSIPIIKVLITMHAGMDTLDFAGPLEVLTHAYNFRRRFPFSPPTMLQEPLYPWRLRG